MLAGVVHILSPEQLEAAPAPHMHPPPSPAPPGHCFSAMQLGPCTDLEAPNPPASHALGKA